MKDVSAWKPLLQELLQEQPVEPAARLLLRLQALGEQRGMGPFSYVELGFPRFRAFLEQFPDVLEMRVRPGGDMEVLSLAAAATQPVALGGERRALSAAREDVWIAFSNPDPQRLRYFNRKTGAVKHFQNTDLSAAADMTPAADWMKIEPVSGTQQTAWMQEFLAQSSTLAAADYPMIAQPYRTAVNVEFTKALGAAGKQWSQFRTGKMFEVMSQWAQHAGVDVSMLLPSFETRHARSSVPNVSLTDVAALSPKQRALKLIESLTDQEIADTLIPLMASIIMVNSRR